MENPFNIWIGNLGKYNEGILVGEWVKLPTTKEEIREVFRRIGLDGVRYEEYHICDYDTDHDISYIYRDWGEYESIDELNYLAQKIEELSEYELELFQAAVDSGDHSRPAELINLTFNLDCITLYSGITNCRELGEFYADGMMLSERLGELEQFFDYEAYGKSFDDSGDGIFTDYGYLVSDYSIDDSYYCGREDIPDESVVFAYPDKPKRIKAQGYER